MIKGSVESLYVSLISKTLRSQAQMSSNSNEQTNITISKAPRTFCFLLVHTLRDRNRRDDLSCSFLPLQSTEDQCDFKGIENLSFRQHFESTRHDNLSCSLPSHNHRANNVISKTSMTFCSLFTHTLRDR